MTPQEIKAKVQAAYVASLQNRAVMYGMRTSPLDHQFRDLKLYGRDAGADCADTNLDRIIDEAVAVAGRKQPSMELQVYGWGRAAIDGMAETCGTGPASRSRSAFQPFSSSGRRTTQASYRAERHQLDR